MVRKDFELVARAIKRLAGDRNGGRSKENVAEIFAAAFEKAEGCHGFDRAKFLQQCGING